MAAMAEAAPGAGIDDIVGGMRAMKTESKEDGDTDALTTAELMERWVSARAAFVLCTSSDRWHVCPTWWRMTGRRRASEGAGASVDLNWQRRRQSLLLALIVPCKPVLDSAILMPSALASSADVICSANLPVVPPLMNDVLMCTAG